MRVNVCNRVSECASEYVSDRVSECACECV